MNDLFVIANPNISQEDILFDVNNSIDEDASGSKELFGGISVYCERSGYIVLFRSEDAAKMYLGRHFSEEKRKTLLCNNKIIYRIKMRGISLYNTEEEK